MRASVLALVLLAACEGTPTGPPPTCHEVAAAWCEGQERCGPVDPACHARWHEELCPALQDAGKPEVSRACLDALAAACAAPEPPVECTTTVTWPGSPPPPKHH